MSQDLKPTEQRIAQFIVSYLPSSMTVKTGKPVRMVYLSNVRKWLNVTELKSEEDEQILAYLRTERRS